jgi:hypothetical protein
MSKAIEIRELRKEFVRGEGKIEVLEHIDLG